MNIKLLWMLGVFFWLGCAWAEPDGELRDPRFRDEGIAATLVTVDVSLNQHGHYVYTYDVVSPESNTGRILQFIVDTSCTDKVDHRGFSEEAYPSKADRSFSEDERHVPVAVNAPWGQAAAFGIGLKNNVGWLVALNPGEQRTGLTLISPYPPGDREYKLIPSVRFGEEQWDYSGYMEDDPELPWIPDWTVTGMTTAPACPGEEYPEEGEPSPHFDGTLFPGQDKELNGLLSYSEPLRDQFHLEAGSRELVMTIHYREDIDPKTFRVTPNHLKQGKLFNPKPGSSETVRIPVGSGMNRIQLQAKSRFTAPDEGYVPGRVVLGPWGPDLDIDVFVVRVPVAEGVAPGKGQGKGQNKGDRP